MDDPRRDKGAVGHKARRAVRTGGGERTPGVSPATAASAAGFTLIELLVVVAIIGILAAIGIPAFSAYRADAYDAHSVSALNSLAKAEEAYFALRGRYTTSIGDLPPYYPPSGVVLTVTAATVQAFSAEANHPQGRRIYRWDSDLGGLQP